jgi:hypothetical protein
MDLYETEIGNLGGKVLANSKNLPSMKTLVLIHNDITEGVEALFKDNENFPNLENIYFNKPKETE